MPVDPAAPQMLAAVAQACCPLVPILPLDATTIDPDDPNLEEQDHGN